MDTNTSTSSTAIITTNTCTNMSCRTWCLAAIGLGMRNHTAHGPVLALSRYLSVLCCYRLARREIQ